MEGRQQQESSSNTMSSDLIPAKMKKICTDEGMDIISSLPDEILHYIFSFLDMESVVKTCVLSTRWRYLWTTLPFLNFMFQRPANNDIEEVFDVGSLNFKFQRPANVDIEEEFVERFRVFVDSALGRRNGSTDIHTFTLSLEQHGIDRTADTRLPKWIDYAVSHNVQMLDITSCTDKVPSLCKELYTCKSLRSLKLHLYGCHLIYPSLDLPFLKHMLLEGINLVSEEGLNNLISGCPVLETLIIEYCMLENSSMITISSPQLKHLEIINVESISDIDTAATITLSTPNLVSFCCQNTSLVDYSFADISSLVEADIDVGENDDLYEKHEGVKKVVEFLEALANVESLSLWLHQRFTEATFVGPERLRTTFHNLSFLRLSIWSIPELRIGETYAIAHLLEKCPNIERFELHLAKDGTREQEELEHEDVGFPSQLVLPHLKYVEIEYAEGSDEEELDDLIKYLEGIALNLDEVALQPYLSGCE